MRCRIGDEDYEFDSQMTVEEAIFLQEKAFVTVLEFGAALQKADARAIAVLMYMLKRRNKEPIRWDDILKMQVFALQILPDSDDDVEATANAEPEEATANADPI